MPIYEFRCVECDEVSEEMLSFKDNAMVVLGRKPCCLASINSCTCFKSSSFNSIAGIITLTVSCISKTAKIKN